MLIASGLIILGNFAATRFEVSHAQTVVKEGQYLLSADIAYSLHSEALEVLKRGLPVRIELQVELFLQRRYWRDKTILVTNKTYELHRNALTERFILSDQEQQQSFASAEEAISAMRYLEDIYLADASAIPQPELTQARARLIVDVRHFPDPLQYLAKYWDDWLIISEWYVWPLKL